MANGTNIGSAYIQIVPSAKGIHGSVSKMFKGEGDSAGTEIGGSIKTRVLGAIKTAGIGAAIAKSVSAGADIEQSWGGIETMFKGSASQMAKYAKEAYRETGVSANEYMEQVTSFSAALIKGLNGDTKKSASVANTAMKDMSDNANKFGTDISAIQNAYQGFAKQNFTMLDNLKLGYGGTASEMARLINDTGVMGKSFKATSKNISEVPFDKMIEAIHKTQKEMGVTGTTSEEASKTISGSMGMTKASIEDFLATLSMSGSEGMKTYGMDVKTALDNVLSSMGTFGLNFGNAALRVLQNAGTLITQYVPTMVTKGMQMLAGMSQGLALSMPQFVSKALDALDGFADNLTTNLPKMIESGKTIISNIINGITNSLPTLIERAPEIIGKFADLVNDNVPKLVKAGADLLVQLGKGIVKSIPVLVANFPKILNAIYKVWKAFNWLKLGKSAITFIKNGINALKQAVPGAVKNVGENAKNFFQSIKWKELGKKVITFIANAIKGAGKLIVSGLKTIGTNGFNAFKGINWASVGKAVIGFIASAAKGTASLVVSALKSVGSSALSAFKSINWVSMGRNIISGIVSGIKANIGRIKSALSSGAQSAFNAAKKFFKIGSPSKLMRDEVGKQIMAGWANGISGNVKLVSGAIDNAAKKTTDKVKKSTSKSVKKGTKAYNTALTEYNKAKKGASESRTKAAETLVKDAITKTGTELTKTEMSLTKQVTYWKKVQKQVKKTSSAYKTATKYLNAAQKSLKTEKATLKANLTANVKEIKAQLETTNAEIKANYAQQISDAKATYNELIASRKSSIMSQTGLFSNQEISLKVGKKTLTKNLQSQVTALQQYNTVMDSLKNKLGVQSSLYNELQSFSVSDLKTLQSINEMNNAELRNYINLWNQKNTLAQTRAEHDESDQLVALNAQITQLTATMNTELANAKASATTQINALSNQYIADLKALGVNTKKTAKSVGKDIGDGISKGLADKKGKVTGTMKDILDAAITAAKKKLKIKSPSRVFRDEIGAMIPEGASEGVADNAKGFTKAVGKMADDAVTANTGFSLSGSVRASTAQASRSANDMTTVVAMMQTIIDSMGNDIVLDTGTLVGSTAPAMNKELGRLARWNR